MISNDIDDAAKLAKAYYDDGAYMSAARVLWRIAEQVQVKADRKASGIFTKGWDAK